MMQQDLLGYNLPYILGLMNFPLVTNVIILLSMNKQWHIFIAYSNYCKLYTKIFTYTLSHKRTYICKIHNYIFIWDIFANSIVMYMNILSIFHLHIVRKLYLYTKVIFTKERRFPLSRKRYKKLIRFASSLRIIRSTREFSTSYSWSILIIL